MIHDELDQLAYRMRITGAPESAAMLIAQARDHIVNQESYIRRLKDELEALKYQMGEPASLRRIARALELAATQGWGNVRGEDLGENL